MNDAPDEDQPPEENEASPRKKGWRGWFGRGEDATPEPEPEPGRAGDDEAAERTKSWVARLREGLSRSSSRLTQGLTDLFTKRRLDDEALEELEEILISADLGIATAATLAQSLAKSRFNQQVTPEEVRLALADAITAILEPHARPLDIDPMAKPHVILVVGVNGSGKTTTIGKMARQFRDRGLRVSIAAGDTFRAAAVEQLKVWGERSGCPVISRGAGADAAGLVFDAIRESKENDDDVLLVDTAGRLQNKSHLMAELQKVLRVMRKADPDAPHSCLLVLDATVGQNAHSQVETFREMTGVGGLVLTKLDGTARGGVLVALVEKFGLPVHYVGVGEQVDDLRPFSARDFARGLMGLED
ncbi:MAG: signal recognition particle-docking protein FtsY [Alphaproteobacteria bacterium]|nr:signal recognition particle-docking protein FtsY [Alphaproteobacteria bacterium]